MYTLPRTRTSHAFAACCLQIPRKLYSHPNSSVLPHVAVARNQNRQPPGRSHRSHTVTATADSPQGCSNSATLSCLQPEHKPTLRNPAIRSQSASPTSCARTATLLLPPQAAAAATVCCCFSSRRPRLPCPRPHRSWAPGRTAATKKAASKATVTCTCCLMSVACTHAFPATATKTVPQLAHGSFWLRAAAAAHNPAKGPAKQQQAAGCAARSHTSPGVHY
jgi:hypothetical protein